jgi:hypothetical protein
MPRRHQRGSRTLKNGRNMWKRKGHVYLLPALRFASLKLVRHRDVMARVSRCEPENDRYLKSSDGRLYDLVVQAVDEVCSLSPQTTWRRTFVKNVSHRGIRIANFAVNCIPADSSRLSFGDWVNVVGKWLGATLILSCMVCCEYSGYIICKL